MNLRPLRPGEPPEPRLPEGSFDDVGPRPSADALRPVDSDGTFSSVLRHEWATDAGS